MTLRRLFVLGSTISILMASPSWVVAASQGRTLLQRDATYEENLRWSASADQAITPGKVIRWMMGIRGSQIFSGGPTTEFQPIVHVNNYGMRLIAAIAIKF